MTSFIVRRLLIFVPFLLAISIVSFVVIQLPPGNYVDTYVQNLQAQGGSVDSRERNALEAEYGLNKPLVEQYGIWMKNIVLHGNFGNSFLFNRPVVSILEERVPRTMGLALGSILLTWLIAVPIGILSAVKKYSVWDHLFTFLSFVGLAVPAFLLALILDYFLYAKTGFLVSGFFSPQYRNASFSAAKFVDLLKNIWLPLFVLVVANTAGVARVMRASLLDELNKPYVTTARSKGMRELRLIMRYPVRIAMNPLISTISWLLPLAIGQEIVVAKVLNLPTVGPVLFQAIESQDVYLTGAIVLLISVLTIVGTLLSDILLAILDPRIRYQ